MKYYIIYASLAILLSCCTSDPALDYNSDDSSTESQSNEIINSAIYTTLSQQYLWSDSLPDKDDTNLLLDPEDYFNNYLRYRVNKLVSYSYDTYGDRFSYMEYTGTSTSSYSSSSTAALEASSGGDPLSDWGFECIYWTYNSVVQYIQILYVVPDSPAYNAGLKRGDLVSKIHGFTISLYNIEVLLAIPDPTLTLVNEMGVTIGSLDLISVDFDNTPLIYSTVIEGSSPKTGYFFYTEFKNDTEYETALKTMFADFKSQGVENVIIDLRYNPGGYVSTAMLIASALTPSVSDLGNTVMFKMQENASYNVFTNYKYYSSSTIGGTGNHVAPSKLAFIMSSYTASASELLCISLRTMFDDQDCVLVGETSVGKNLASLTYTVSDWSYHPITARIHDQYGISGYETGLVPEVAINDLDSSSVSIKDIGDTDERMLSAALDALGVSISTDAESALSSSTSYIDTKSSMQYTPQYRERREYPSLLLDI